ncbi:helix-turn-helix transcriptional regulator [Streptomyces luteireticuli]|uniref:Helix-turn-helix transcriptional regulator n=1 Tax=Streptomyces luteireticuli TaxID=173858 RepID=A0ABN0Z6L1_9ACTN
MPGPKSPRSEKRFVDPLGALIRELRLRRGWTQAELGRAVGLSNSAISKFENGQKVPPRDIVLRLDAALRAAGRLIDEADRLGGRAKKYSSYEARALTFRHLTEFVPALLQTEEFIRESLRRGMKFYGGDLEENVRYRLARASLMDHPDAPQFSAVIGESALHTRVGNSHIMHDQLSRLISASMRPNVQIRITPFDGDGLLARNANLTIMTLPGEQTIVYRGDPIQSTYVTKPDGVTAYIALYDHLFCDALSEEASIALIRKVIEEKYGEHRTD